MLEKDYCKIWNNDLKDLKIKIQNENRRKTWEHSTNKDIICMETTKMSHPIIKLLMKWEKMGAIFMGLKRKKKKENGWCEAKEGYLTRINKCVMCAKVEKSD